jgi:hypothetical protein
MTMLSMWGRWWFADFEERATGVVRIVPVPLRPVEVSNESRTSCE